jgi:hypothetical protein
MGLKSSARGKRQKPTPGEELMTRLSGLALLVAGITVAGPATAADLTGVWQIRATFSDGQAVIPTCIFQAAGQRFTGSCDGPSSNGSASAVSNGQQVEFMWNATPKKGPGTGIAGNLAFFGSMNAVGTVSGSATDPSGAKGTFTASRR